MACTCTSRSLSPCPSKKPSRWSAVSAWQTRLRAQLGATFLVLALGAAAGCADTKPAIEYSANQLLGMWNESMRSLADQHAGCPYERDLPFNHKQGACYPLKCKDSGNEVALLRKHDGGIYKCDSGCDGGCSAIAR